MKTVARIVTRLQGENDGLFIGSLFKDGKGILKPNTIYELKEVLGTIELVEVGQACGGGPNNCKNDMMSSGEIMFHWGQDIGNIIGTKGPLMFLTLEEYNTMREQTFKDY
jgi:hypothetical protein